MDSLPWFQFADFLDAASEIRAVSSHALDFSQGAQSRSRRPSSSKGLAVGSLDDTAAKDLSQQPVMGVVVQTNANQVHDNRYNMISLIKSMESSTSNRDGRQAMSKVLSLLPETTQDNVSATLQSPDMQLLKLLMYLLSNNHDNSYMMNGVTGALDKDEIKGLLYRHQRSQSGPTSEALSEKIFQSALRAQDIDVIQTVLSSGIDPNEQGIINEATPLQFISRTGNVGIASILIKAGANVNGSLPSGLRHSSKSVPGALRYAAVGKSSAMMIYLLLSVGAHANTADGTSALCDSVKNGDILSVQLLISAGADVKNRHDGYTALHMASKSSEMVNILLRAGADVNAVTDSGTPSLALAVVGGYTDVVQSLLAWGPKIFGPVICFAADRDDIELVRILLDAGADIDGCSNHSKRTGLTAAVEKNNANLVKFLLDSGANVEGKPSYMEVAWDKRENWSDFRDSHWNNYTPLQAAAFHERIEVAGILLEAGADINAWNAEFFDCNCGTPDCEHWALNGTAVQIAAHQGNMELVRLLCEAGANVNAPAYRRGGRTALQAAVENGNREVVDFLLTAGADINAAAAEEDGRSALAAAIMRHDISLFSSLLEAGAIISDSSVRRSGVTALAAATANRDIERVRYSLFAGADPVDSAALLAAVKNEDVELIRILLTARADCNMREDDLYGYTALYAAVRNLNHEIVGLLLASGIKVFAWPPDSMSGYMDYIPLHRQWIRKRGWVEHPSEMAIESGDLRMVRTFLEAGADPNYVSDYASRPYDTCLGLAIIFEAHVSVIQTLLEAGANVNAPISWQVGHTALQTAVECGNEDVVDILLEAGADVNAPPASFAGVTALQAAAIRGFLRIARVLLENGADVNAAAAEERGRTALEGAAEHGRIDMLQFLLDNGAVIEGPGRDQYESAINRAAENGHKAACNLLRSHHRRLYGSP